MRIAIQTPIRLNAAEKAIAAQIDFDAKVLVTVKRAGNNQISEMKPYSFRTNEQITENSIPYGLQITTQEEAGPLVARLRLELLPEGYIPFYSGKPHESHTVLIIRSSEPFDVIRAMQTTGNDARKSTADILACLQRWQQRYNIGIWGAGSDWTYIQFSFSHLQPSSQLEFPFAQEAATQRFTMPLGDCTTLAEEAFALCPDLINQGYYFPAKEKARNSYPFCDDEASIHTLAMTMLARDIQRTHRLFLWWD